MSNNFKNTLSDIAQGYKIGRNRGDKPFLKTGLIAVAAAATFSAGLYLSSLESENNSKTALSGNKIFSWLGFSSYEVSKNLGKMETKQATINTIAEVAQDNPSYLKGLPNVKWYIGLAVRESSLNPHDHIKDANSPNHAKNTTTAWHITKETLHGLEMTDQVFVGTIRKAILTKAGEAQKYKEVPIYEYPYSQKANDLGVFTDNDLNKDIKLSLKLITNLHRTHVKKFEAYPDYKKLVKETAKYGKDPLKVYLGGAHISGRGGALKVLRTGYDSIGDYNKTTAKDYMKIDFEAELTKALKDTKLTLPENLMGNEKEIPLETSPQAKLNESAIQKIINSGAKAQAQIMPTKNGGYALKIAEAKATASSPQIS